MFQFLIVLFLCTLVGCNSKAASTASTLAIGTSKTTFDDLVATLHAKDIGKHMAMRPPSKGGIWEFADHDAVISVSFDSANNIGYLDYCSIADFDAPQLQRTDSTIAISQITFNSNNTTSHVPLAAN